MGLVINTNRLSLDAQAALRTNNRDLEVTAKRLSTGKRVNTAGDDAAGMTIAQRITSDVRAYRKTIQNQMDGISLIQVAEGQLQGMQDDLQRIRELMIQAANGTNGPDERNALQREINERVKNIEDVSNTTRFNSVGLLKGPSTDRTNQTDRTIQSGITFSETTNLQFGPAYIDTTTVASPVFVNERGINIDANYSYTPLTATQDSAAAEVLAGTASFDYVTKVIGDIRTELTAQGASSVALDG
ncbi:MAG: flagellin, partial [bacterium]